MARPRGSRQVAARTFRRKTAWDAGPGGVAVVNITVSTAVFLGSAISLVGGVSEVTFVRLRGYFDAFLATGSASGDGYQGAFGIGVASLAAVTAGIASVPTPITEAGAENWMYYRIFGAHVATSTIGDGVNAPSASSHFDVDSKAMRKFSDEMAMYAAVEVTEIGTATLKIHFDSRILSKLA